MTNCIDTIERDRWGWLHQWLDALRGSERPVARDPGHRSAAPSMMMVSRDIKPLVIRVADRLAAWHDRHEGRGRLMMLDDRMLKDIGIDRAAAEEEYRKPFWR